MRELILGKLQLQNFSIDLNLYQENLPIKISANRRVGMVQDLLSDLRNSVPWNTILERHGDVLSSYP